MKSKVALKSFRSLTIEILRNSGFMALKMLAEDVVAREGPLSSQMEWPFGMGKARFELARISPRDPKSRSSARSDTSPSLWTLYY